MSIPQPSKVESYFINQSSIGFLTRSQEHLPVVTVENYVTLGQLTALRFLEWVKDNPEGLVALPTGKTPEYFIKWFHYYLNNWSKETRSGILDKIGIGAQKKPSCKGLTFVQIDEFFPLDPDHDRSFNHYVRKYYLKEFGFDSSKALLIDTYSFPESILHVKESHYSNLEELFSNGPVDFSLRFRQAQSDQEELQQKVIRFFDFLCQEYEEKIRLKGGIGFFLGGIGPDGHVGFNVKGSSHFSVTRLTNLNYESLAAAAGDMGGIEAVRKKAVITIGLGTITFNPETVAIIFAAGQTKAGVVSSAIVNDPHTDYPGTALQKLPNARMYLTHGAASSLIVRRNKKLIHNAVSDSSVISSLVIEGAKVCGHTLNDTPRTNKLTQLPESWKLGTKLAGKQIPILINNTKTELLDKINNGVNIPDNQCFLHTGPHHDDIELAYFPLIHHLVRSSSNINHFSYLTSGFTSVTNDYVVERLTAILFAIKTGVLERALPLSSLFNNKDRQREINGYLNAIAGQSREQEDLFTSVRLVRNLFGIVGTHSLTSVEEYVQKQLDNIKALKPGSMDPEPIRDIKAWIREWEADTVWSHFGLGIENVHHLRLKFYTGDIFPNDPQFTRDVVPLLDLFYKVKPTIVTLALDPEGSGPDTHYKCLMALRAAIKEYVDKTGNRDLRVWGYRNVWSRFSLHEVNTIVPVSLNSFAVLHSMFNICFVSQKSASFPSYEYDGTFSELAQKVWVEQFKDLTSLIGDELFYNSDHPMMRRAFGAIYLKNMSYDEFMKETQALEELDRCKGFLGGPIP